MLVLSQVWQLLSMRWICLSFWFCHLIRDFLFGIFLGVQYFCDFIFYSYALNCVLILYFHYKSEWWTTVLFKFFKTETCERDSMFFLFFLLNLLFLTSCKYIFVVLLIVKSLLRSASNLTWFFWFNKYLWIEFILSKTVSFQL